MTTKPDKHNIPEETKVREVPWEEMPRQLGAIADRFHSVLTTIQSAFDRDNRGLVLFNLGFRAAIEFERLREWVAESNDLLASSVRNIYEIELILRYIVSSDELQKEWIGQSLSDEEDIVKGFQVLRDQYSAATSEVHEKTRGTIASLRSDFEFESTGPWKVYAIAQSLGRETEYRFMYKFLSKYVHPSSWIINSDSDRTNSDSYRNLLVAIGQILIQRIEGILETAFDIQGRIQVAKERPIPWKRSSYDHFPHSVLRGAHKEIQAELDGCAKRWNRLKEEPDASDVYGLELYARFHYITQRFDWPSWPKWEEHAVKLYAGAARCRKTIKECGLVAPEDAAIIERIKEDIGETRFAQLWAIGSALEWREAIIAAVSPLSL